MKRAVAAVLTVALALGLCACGTMKRFEVAMVTGIGALEDKSFNQGTWQGVQAFAEENGKACQVYRPEGEDDAAFLKALEKAVAGGAKVVVAPGFTFAGPIARAQTDWPEVSFILIDAVPDGGAGTNTVGVTFAEQQAGYLAGYAAVADGHTELGFLGGMNVAAVARYGFGFLKGASDAAVEQGVVARVQYRYLGTFEPSDTVRQAAQSWFDGGTQVIFGCAGGASESVIAAADAAGAWAIGVDVDQAGEGAAVLTSATKGLGEAARQMLVQYYEGDFPGGRQVVLGAKAGAVALPMGTSRFTRFTPQQYEAVYQKLARDEVTLPAEAADGSPVELAKSLAGLELEYYE